MILQYQPDQADLLNNQWPICIIKYKTDKKYSDYSNFLCLVNIKFSK
jgi:hypothetical protein